MFLHSPFNAIDCRVTEAPDIIVVTVYWASGGKHQSVTGQTDNLENHDFFTQTTVDLKEKHHIHLLTSLLL